MGILFGFLKHVFQLLSWQKMMLEILIVLYDHISVCKNGNKVKDGVPHWNI